MWGMVFFDLLLGGVGRGMEVDEICVVLVRVLELYVKISEVIEWVLKFEFL